MHPRQRLSAHAKAWNYALSTPRLAEAFDAFDTDQSGELDYEEFVMMVSSRGVSDQSTPDKSSVVPPVSIPSKSVATPAAGVQSWYDNGKRLTP